MKSKKKQLKGDKKMNRYPKSTYQTHNLDHEIVIVSCKKIKNKYETQFSIHPILKDA